MEYADHKGEYRRTVETTRYFDLFHARIDHRIRLDVKGGSPYSASCIVAITGPEELQDTIDLLAVSAETVDE